MAAASDRNLLFGILAVQMDFVTREQLLDAMAAWMLDKQTPLGEILCRRGVLAEDDRADLDRLVHKHVQRHGNDPQASLAALRVEPSVRRDLGQIDDPEVQASLAGLPAQDSPGTAEGKAEDSFAVLPTTAPVGDAASSIRFRRLREHAKGGLGEVFVALDAELDREVALKEIQARHADHPESRARFLTEARVTGALEHPGIVPVYGLGVYPDGRPYYAMRFIKGDSLRDAIAAFHAPQAQGLQPLGLHSLAFRQLLRRFVDVCNAIAYAHDKGVIHRDLKPANVMLGKFGETLVVDWGLAKVMGQADVEATTASVLISSGDSAWTQAGQALGTPAFMSPEQAAGRLDRLGPASDTYSLGATLYCLLTGKAPFPEKDVGVVLAKVQKGDFQPPRQVKASVPPPLQAVCLKAMALKPQERYSSPRELAEEIEHWLADEPVKAYPEARRARLARWGRRHKPLVASAAALLLAAVVALSLGLVLLGQANTEIQGQKRAADEAKREAEKRGDELAALNDTLRQAKYIADMNLARVSWDENNLIRTRELLEQHRPRPGETDLRGFEWHYLRRLYDQELRTIKAHGGTALTVTYTPDGKRLITSGATKRDMPSSGMPSTWIGGEVKLWDAATGRQLPLELKGLQDNRGGVALSRDGKLLAAGSTTGAARVWDLKTGDSFTLDGPGKTRRVPTQVRFSPDGKSLACEAVFDLDLSSNETEISIWDLATRKAVVTIGNLAMTWGELVFSPDGKYVATGYFIGGIKVWDAATGREAFTCQYGEGKIAYCAAFDSDGKRLVACGTDGIHVFDVATWQRLSVWPSATTGSNACLTFSPDGTRLAAGSTDGLVELWDTQTGHRVDTFRGHVGMVCSMAFSPDSARLASSGIDGSVRIWDTKRERVALQLPPTAAGRRAKRYLELNTDGQTVLTGVGGTSIRLWSASTGEPRAGPFEHEQQVLSVNLTYDGKRLIVADKGKHVRIWDVASRQVIRTFPFDAAFTAVRGYISPAAVSRDGRWYALPERGGAVSLYDTTTGVRSRSFKGLSPELVMLEFSPDGSKLVAGGSGQTLTVWDVATGREAAVANVRGININRVRFSPDGKRLAVVGHDPYTASDTRIMNLDGGDLVLLKGHALAVLDVAFSPDGKRVATASTDKTVRVWDPASGQELLILKGHTGPVRSVRFSADGRRLISVATDRTVRVWNATPLPR